MADIRSLAATLRRHPDPATSTDTEVRRLVAQLRVLPVGPRPSDEFRAQLRAQLVAVTPRLVAEGTAGEPATSPTHSAWATVRARAQRMPLRRPLAVMGTLVVIFGLLLTGAVWLSSRTLPGDSLYGLKRAGENVQLSLTSGAGARGREYLDLARRRTEEVSSLLSRASAIGASAAGPHAAGGINDHAVKLITKTLADADSDLRNGSRLLAGQAVHNAAPASLDTLATWAPGQIARMTSITGRIPSGALHDRAAASQQLASRALARANKLRAELGCSCLSDTATDDLGPLPCTTRCTPPLSRPARPGTSAPASSVPGLSNAPGQPSGGTSSSQSRVGPHRGSSSQLKVPKVSGSSSGQASVTTSPSATSSSATPATGGLPSLPLTTDSTGPVTVDSCGLTLSLGSLGIGVGPCGLHLRL